MKKTKTKLVPDYAKFKPRIIIVLVLLISLSSSSIMLASGREKEITGTEKNADRIPFGVLLPETTGGTDCTSRYILEILGHAGVPFQKLTGSISDLSGYILILIPGNFSFSNEIKAGIEKFVSKGGNLIGIGGTSGMDSIFGVKTCGPGEEGYIKINSDNGAKYNFLTDAFESSLHWWRGSFVVAGKGISLARILDERHTITDYDAIVANRYGKGIAILYTPDLVYSILHIQQGIDIKKDGEPAPDGSAQIKDDILKTDDGMVLDWEWDRGSVDKNKFFVYPVADELRELILKGIFYIFSQSSTVFPVVWYWKDGMDAVGLLSHDSDGNDPDLAAKLFNLMCELDVKSTWCIMYPGGYSPKFYRELRDNGYEIALHYDAKTGGPGTNWSFGDFKIQHNWLFEISHLKSITSNKNHYFRWQGYLDFFQWLEDAGIQVDQSKGPSKKGNVGFIFGGSHPWFPMDESNGSFIDVLEINLMTQDLVLVCPYIVGPTIVDQVLKHNGVAHFLFHPSNIERGGVANALRKLVEYAKGKGLVWWTSRQINNWERARRSIEIYGLEKNEDGFCFKADIPSSMEGVTVVAMLPKLLSVKYTSLIVNGKEVPVTVRNYLGFDFAQFIAPDTGSLEVVVKKK